MGCPINQPTVIQHNVEYSAIVRSRSSQAERKVNSVSSIHFNLTGLVVEKIRNQSFGLRPVWEWSVNWGPPCVKRLAKWVIY